MIDRPELTLVQREKLIALWEALKGWSVPKQSRFKKSTGYGRSCAFGFIRKRSYKPGVSALNVKKPKIWKAIKEFADSTGFEYDSVQVNQNCVCGKHRDKKNVGISYLVSFGDYTGGELMVEDVEYDCNMKPIVFNGAELEHWNNELQGSKWSIVLFKTTIPTRFLKDFPEDWRTCKEYVDMKLQYSSQELQNGVNYII